MMITALVYILMPVSIILAFLWAPPAKILGEASRIIYFHVPCAWVSALAFLIAGIASVIFLYDKKRRFPFIVEKAHNSAAAGMVFTILTVITGSIWAKISWGTYWNWDPRETSIVILLLVYIAYFSLRTALRDNPNSGRLASVYLVFAMAVMPFLVFVVPRVIDSLHPETIINAEKKIDLDPAMRLTLSFSMISFTLLFFYILSLANRITRLNRLIEEKENEKNI